MNTTKLLIITSQDDAHADYLIDTLNKSDQGKNVIRINTEQFTTNTRVFFNESKFRLHIYDSNKIVESNDIRSVWFRRPKPFNHDHLDPEIRDFVIEEYNSFLRGIYFCCHDTAIWVNPLPALHRARIKMQQLQSAKITGFNTPKTVVSNNYDDILYLFSNVSHICYKPLGDHDYNTKHQIFTRPISLKEFTEKRETISLCPALFQEYIDKLYDIRVVIIGNQVFAFEIHSQDNELSIHDFRGISPDRIPHKPHLLPTSLIKKIQTFIKSQGLVFSSLDLIKATNGEYYFLENNPNGQWLWLELLTGIPLTKYMIDLLLS